MKLIPLAITALLISGCQPSQSSGQNLASTPTQIPVAEKKTTVDLSTPDRALKSYWQEYDTYLKSLAELNNKEITQNAKQKQDMGVHYKKTISGDVLAVFEEKQKERVFSVHSREIISIKQETESRTIAIATVKNITPIPSTVSLSKEEVTSRNAGQSVKYLLEKDAEGWKVSQSYYEGYEDGKDVWEKRYSLTKSDDKNPSYIY